MPAEHSAEEIRNYLRDLFEASFDEGPRKLLKVRAEFLGIDAANLEPEAPDPQELLAKRSELETQIGRLRRAFWTSDLAKLRKSLQLLDCPHFPDLHDAVLKLKRTAKFRAQFPQVVQHKDFQPDLFQAFKKVVILSPKESAPIKEALLLQMRREGSGYAMMKMVNFLRDDFPELYQLEAQWFELVRGG